jgi:hypothetical protein
MKYDASFAGVTDDELLRRLAVLLAQSRRAESELVAHIGEVDRRRLFARAASPSMFAYCTEVLHLSEAEAYLRITAARAARKHPVILEMLGDGRLHLSGIAKLVPHLTAENAADLLGRAAHRSKCQIEELVAKLAPRPDVPAVIRRLPERVLLPEAAQTRPDSRGGHAAAAEPHLDAPERPDTPLLRPDGVASTIPLAPAPEVEQLSAVRFRVQFTASAELRRKLERLQALMRSQTADPDLAAVIEQAVTETLERLEARRFGTTKAPRKSLSDTDVTAGSRYIPAAVRRAVHARDEGRCRYVDREGRRCPERHRLEYHHRHPYGLGGDRSLRNVCLMCPTHNRYLAEQDYGPGKARMGGTSRLAST